MLVGSWLQIKKEHGRGQGGYNTDDTVHLFIGLGRFLMGGVVVTLW